MPLDPKGPFEGSVWFRVGYTTGDGRRFWTREEAEAHAAKVWEEQGILIEVRWNGEAS